MYTVPPIGMALAGMGIVDMALAGEGGMEDGMVVKIITALVTAMAAGVYIEAQAQGKVAEVICIKEDRISGLGVL